MKPSETTCVLLLGIILGCVLSKKPCAGKPQLNETHSAEVWVWCLNGRCIIIKIAPEVLHTAGSKWDDLTGPAPLSRCQYGDYLCQPQ